MRWRPIHEALRGGVAVKCPRYALCGDYADVALPGGAPGKWAVLCSPCTQREEREFRWAREEAGNLGVPFFAGDRAKRRELVSKWGLPSAWPAPWSAPHEAVNARAELFVDDDADGAPRALWYRYSAGEAAATVDEAANFRAEG